MTAIQTLDSINTFGTISPPTHTGETPLRARYVPSPSLLGHSNPTNGFPNDNDDNDNERDNAHDTSHQIGGSQDWSYGVPNPGGSTGAKGFKVLRREQDGDRAGDDGEMQNTKMGTRGYVHGNGEGSGSRQSGEDGKSRKWDARVKAELEGWRGGHG
jgi:hypothetical protein